MLHEILASITGSCTLMIIYFPNTFFWLVFNKNELPKQVLNGFFWDGQPVGNHDREALPSTALGVSDFLFTFVFFSALIK